MTNKNLSSIHPGEILLEEFLRPMGISQYRLAKDISVSPRRINEIVHGKRAITADTALRLGRFRQMAYWGLGRLSEARPKFTVKAVPDLLQVLSGEGDASKGLICWTLGSLRAKEA
jgi:addiction module HigA family antidote